MVLKFCDLKILQSGPQNYKIKMQRKKIFGTTAKSKFHEKSVFEG